MASQKVNILWDYSLDAKQCIISDDLLLKLDNARICQLRFSDIIHDGSTYLVHFDVDEKLDRHCIKLSSKLLNLAADDFNVDFCFIETINKSYSPPVIDELTLLVEEKFYDSLKALVNNEQVLKFLCNKCNMTSHGTILHVDEIVIPNWCQIINILPYRQGVIDFSNTNVVLVKDKYQILKDKTRIGNVQYEKESEDGILLKGLDYPISDELLIPRLEDNDQVANFDNTLNVFMDLPLLTKLNLSSGSYIEIKNSDGLTAMARVFVLVQPHNYPQGFIYAHPRLIHKFRHNLRVTIKGNLNFNLMDVPIARNLRLTKIADPLQLQKKYENVIANQLKSFFLDRKRLLKLNDSIPIVFDSTLAEIYNKNSDTSFFTTDGSTTHVDSMVWFKVDFAALYNNEPANTNAFFQVEPIRTTKLAVQGVISEDPLPLQICNYINYFQLPPLFSFNHQIFPYAKTLLNNITSSLKLSSSKTLPPTNILIHSSTPNVGKETLLQSCATMLGLNIMFIDIIRIPYTLNSLDAVTKILGYIKAKIEMCITGSKTSIIICLTHLNSLFKDVDPNQDPTAARLNNLFEVQFIDLLKNAGPKGSNGVIFTSTTNNRDKLPTRIRSLFNFEINVPVPNEKQRLEIFKFYLSEQVLNYGNFKGIDDNLKLEYILDNKVNLEKLTQQSAGLTAIDIKSIVQRAKNECYTNSPVEGLIWNNGKYIISNDHIYKAISKVRDEFSVSIGAPKIPNVSWDDIGGVSAVRDEIMDTIDMPLRHPELFGHGMKQRSGILFYGPPGTGKTLMAKAIASNFSLNFFSVKGPELLNMYIGESEANVRKVFQRARDAKPCVIFFDEIDSVAPKRGNQGDSGGVMDRIVSQLLAELDGMSSNGDGVFVIGATNRPDLLDDSLLRPGRFDKLLYLGVPDDNEKQLNILNALTRKFNLDQDVELMKIAELCPFHYSGADFYALCSDAMLNAMLRVANEVDVKLLEYNEHANVKLTLNQWFDKVATSSDTKVTVKMEDFVKAQSHLTPSISQDELNHYLKIKNSFVNGSNDDK